MITRERRAREPQKDDWPKCWKRPPKNVSRPLKSEPKPPRNADSFSP